MMRKSGSIRALSIFLSLATLVLGGGCAARNQQVEQTSNLWPGKTTEQEAVTLLGSTPVSYYSQSDGSYIATWQCTQFPFMAPSRTNRISVLFDRHNVMIKIVSQEESIEQDRKITVK